MAEVSNVSPNPEATSGESENEHPLPTAAPTGAELDPEAVSEEDDKFYPPEPEHRAGVFTTGDPEAANDISPDADLSPGPDGEPPRGDAYGRVLGPPKTNPFRDDTADE